MCLVAPHPPYPPYPDPTRPDPASTRRPSFAVNRSVAGSPQLPDIFFAGLSESNDRSLISTIRAGVIKYLSDPGYPPSLCSPLPDNRPSYCHASEEDLASLKSPTADQERHVCASGVVGFEPRTLGVTDGALCQLRHSPRFPLWLTCRSGALVHRLQHRLTSHGGFSGWQYKDVDVRACCLSRQASDCLSCSTAKAWAIALVCAGLTN